MSSSAIVRAFSKVNRVCPVEVYPLVGIVSVACGFGVYTSARNMRKNKVAAQDMSQPKVQDYSPSKLH